MTVLDQPITADDKQTADEERAASYARMKARDATNGRLVIRLFLAILFIGLTIGVLALTTGGSS